MRGCGTVEREYEMVRLMEVEDEDERMRGVCGYVGS